MNYYDKLKDYPSAIALVASNLTPLAGVLFWNWKVSSVLALYLLELVIVGFFTFFKIIFAGKVTDKNSVPIPEAAVPFMEGILGIFFFVSLWGILIYLCVIFIQIGGDNAGLSGDGKRGVVISDIPWVFVCNKFLV